MKQIITVILLIATSYQLPAQQDALPAKRPADLTLSFHLDGGMSYHFEDITISNDSCVYKLNDHGAIRVTHFKLTEQDMDSLYAVLVKNQFTQIKFRDGGMVYDRGGETITIGWNNNQKLYTVNDVQDSFVLDGWKAKWVTICAYVTKLPQLNKGKTRNTFPAY